MDQFVLMDEKEIKLDPEAMTDEHSEVRRKRLKVKNSRSGYRDDEFKLLNQANAALMNEGDSRCI